VVKLAEASFLGFQIVRRKLRWTAKSQKKFKAEVKQIAHPLDCPRGSVSPSEATPQSPT
jgi:hypothetical protein